jgi:hypothetical protein
MAGYFITYKLSMDYQKDIVGLISLPPSYKLTEQEILFAIIRKEPKLRQAISLSVRASEVNINKMEDYLLKTYSQEQISDLLILTTH